MGTFLSFLLGLAVWSALGLLCVWMLRRNGHSIAWAGLALWLGPIVLLLVQSIPQRSGRVIYLKSGEQLPGTLNVLVGLDGSAESLASAKAALDPLRPSLRRVRLMSAVDLETGEAPQNTTIDDELLNHLEEAKRALDLPDAELALVSGRADHALVNHAIDEAMDLLVVAHRQHRFASVVLGSTVARLAKHSSIPILIGPPVEDAADTSPNDHSESNHVF